MKTFYYQTKFVNRKNQKCGFIRSIEDLENIFNDDLMCDDRYNILAKCAPLIETREERLSILEMMFLSYNFMKYDIYRRDPPSPNKFCEMYYKFLRMYEITDQWEDEWLEIIQKDPGKYVGNNKSLKITIEMIKDL